MPYASVLSPHCDRVFLSQTPLDPAHRSTAEPTRALVTTSAVRALRQPRPLCPVPNPPAIVSEVLPHAKGAGAGLEFLPAKHGNAVALPVSNMAMTS